MLQLDIQNLGAVEGNELCILSNTVFTTEKQQDITAEECVSTLTN